MGKKGHGSWARSLYFHPHKPKKICWQSPGSPQNHQESPLLCAEKENGEENDPEVPETA